MRLIRLAGYALAASLSLFTTEGLAVSIGPGFDLLKTAVSGSYVDLREIPEIGRIVELVGNPLPGLGGVDTIVERKAGCDFDATNPCTIAIQLIKLSLRSKDPVDISGTFFDVFVTEQPPDPITPPDPVMTITLNSAGDGGKFNSSLPVKADLTFTQVGNPSNSFHVSFFDVFTSLDVPWSTMAPPGWPSSDEYPAGGFYPGVLPPSVTGGRVRFVGFDEQALLARHRIPEPATLALFGAGLGLMGWRRRKLA
jgi:hypothetical protein